MQKTSFSLILTLFVVLFLSGCANATSWPDPYKKPNEPVVVNQPTQQTIPDEQRPPSVETMPLPESQVIIPSEPEVVQPAPPPPPVQAEPIKEHPAVVALRGQAMEHLRLEQPEQAAASIERAIRIQPNNADLWLDLGAIRFSQKQYVQAESMSKKAISYASQMQQGKQALLHEAWIMIANARYARNDKEGGDRAAQEASRYDPNLST